MKPLIAIEVTARTILWFFIFASTIIMTEIAGAAPKTYMLYVTGIALECLQLAATFRFADEDIAWDIRELAFYDLVAQCIGLWLHFNWYNLSLYVTICDAVFMMKVVRLLWLATVPAGGALISWPIIGPVGYFRAKLRKSGPQNAPTRQQANHVYVAILACFAVSAIFEFWKVNVSLLFWAAATLLLIILFFRPFMRYLRAQHEKSLADERAAGEKAATEAMNAQLVAMNAQLVAMNEQLSETNRQLTLAKAEAIRSAEILRDATHDMKHPISSLNLVTEDLFSETDPVKLAELKKKLRYFISSFGEHIDDTIEVAKLETSLIVPDMETLCTRELLFFTWEHLTTISNASFTPLKLCRSGGFASDFAVITDNNLFHRIINNLAINALYHCQRTGPMLPGQRDKKVLLTLRKKGNKCVVAVWDQGPGIPRADGPDGAANFRQFAATIKDRRMAEASTSLHHGLGVNNVRVLCERLGSPMQLRSIVGRGSVFYFEIPLADAAYATSN